MARQLGHVLGYRRVCNTIDCISVQAFKSQLLYHTFDLVVLVLSADHLGCLRSDPVVVPLLEHLVSLVVLAGVGDRGQLLHIVGRLVYNAVPWGTFSPFW